MLKPSLRPLSLLLFTSLGVLLFNGVDVSEKSLNLSPSLRIGQPAIAKSSGGRSGGGSFKRGSSSRSSGGRSKGSSSYRSPSYHRNPTYHRDSYQRYPTTYRVYGGRPHPLFTLLLFGVGSIVLFLIIYTLLKSLSQQNSTETVSDNVLDNDIFTISKVQVALTYHAQDVQESLTELSLRVKTDTLEGLKELYDETLLILLRNQEDWTHVNATSRRVTLNNAEAVFSEFSIEERTKLNAETLSNMAGKLRQQTVKLAENEAGCYVVVTLIIGTAHDKPLFTEIRQKEELETVLKRLASIPSDYLLKFEVIWSPQTPEDTMTYDEFLLEYTNMLTLA